MTRLPLPDSRRWNHNIHYHRVVLAAVPEGCRRALDVGCGEGQLTRELHRRVPHVIGLDPDAASTELARAQGTPDLAYVVGDVLTHPFEKASFDLVTSVAALHHMDAATGLTRMAELLRPGGVLVVIGLAHSRLPTDLPYELAAAVGHRVHALTKPVWEHPSPKVWPPPETYAGMRRIAGDLLPGVRFRRHLLWRYSLVWTKPGAVTRRNVPRPRGRCGVGRPSRTGPSAPAEPAGPGDHGEVASHRRTGAVVLGTMLVGLAAVACSAVGSPVADPGPQQTQGRAISTVSTVELAASGELVLTGGNTASLHITAGRNVIRHLTSDVQGDRLTLGSDGSVQDLGRVRYDLVLPSARVVEVSGSGNVEVTAPSALQQVLLPGSGRIRVDGLRAEQLTVDLSGSGEVAVAGTTTRQRISIGGSGRYSAAALASRDAEVTISGSGSADLAVSRTLTATVSGSGAVTYSGDAAVRSSVTGSGTVVRR